MKKGYIMIVGLAMVAAAAFATPTKIVEENFEGTQFPPAGWRTLSGWGWGSETGNRFASGYQSGPGVSLLHTYKFELDKGTPITIEFEYRARRSGMGSSAVQVHLFYGTYGSGTYVWHQNLYYPSTWTKAGAMGIQIPETRSDYYCRWLVGATSYASTGFDVDNVIVKLENTGVERTSLGRVRALYY